jgi:eukaryotic-like serine/threonine-protein kinase
VPGLLDSPVEDREHAREILVLALHDELLMAAVPSQMSQTLPVIVESERPTTEETRLAKPRRRTKPATLAPGDRIGAWRVEGALGRGGMGTVYAVTHNGFGKRAALKLCHKHVLGPEFTVDTFLREARVVHLVNHPGVCDVFATGTYDGRPYLALERLHGATLGDYLETTQITKLAALDILADISRVLASAHAAGVVHRDLKLDNVFVLEGDARRIKVLDWGVAKILGEEDPLKGMIAGTLTYVAPEQIRGEELTCAADVYALGVLAYQLFGGAPPFVDADDLGLIKKHLRAAPPPPRALWAEIPAELEALMLAMLAKDPARRPTIDGVLAAIAVARDALQPKQRTLLARIPATPPVDALGRSAPPFSLRGILAALFSA